MPTSLVDKRRAETSASKEAAMRAFDGRRRAVIERVQPEIDAGRFPIKRIVGHRVAVHAHVFADGHDAVVAVLRHRYVGEEEWNEVEMTPLYNDEWTAEFVVERVGTCEYTVIAWVDRFLTWHRDFQKRAAAGQVAPIDLLTGAELIAEAASRADGDDRAVLESWARRLANVEAVHHVQQVCDDADLPSLIKRYPSRDFAAQYDRVLSITVDRKRAGFSAWYEMFPRSAAGTPGKHGTFKDVEARLPYIASMGFDILYLPPIHPIGTTFRKGKNNVTDAHEDDVGSPWGIGAAEGGHKAIHPDLGTPADFRSLVAAANRLGIEVALDVALQCSPDHPYVKQHPEWFRRRPDGTVQYAENPPKKYQDIYPFDFETADWRALWQELKSIFDHWIGEGVTIFRVDNPHTKPFAFWEWCLGEIRREHPEVLFLSEAFTRPKIMYRLAKLGFTQSYTYFAWRNTKQELTDYVMDLAATEVREFFYPNFWPNTPDILTEYMQVGGRAAHMARLVLAATLSPNYGVYGPPFEHAWTAPREPGSEEYLDSEKYQIHYHDIDRPDSLKDFIARVNEIRREHTVLHAIDNVEFHPVDNDQLICYTKSSADKAECLLVVVNLDPHHVQSGWIDLPLDKLGVDEQHPYQVHDLLSDARYLWNGRRNFVQLDPHVVPAHIFQVRRRVRSERDFEYYL